MPSALVVNASGRPISYGSISRQIVEKLVAKLAPDSVVTREANVGLPFVDGSWIDARFNPSASEDSRTAFSTSKSNELVEELKAADIIIIGCPIYNFGISAALKSWIDLVAVVGQTFHYTATGPEGLLKDKKVYVALASLGVTVGAPNDFVTPYLRYILSFIGLTDVTFIDGTKGNLAQAEEQIEALSL